LTTLSLSYEERLHVAAQHYANTFGTILEAFENISSQRRMIVKLEEFLMDPIKHLGMICERTGLSFDEDMLPQPHHRYPFGTPDQSKWYPLKKDVNSKYLKQLDEKAIEVIQLYCGKITEQFSYTSVQ